MSKQLVMEVLNSLPEVFSMDDFFEILYLKLKTQDALEDVKNGDVLSTEELKKEMEKWK